MYIFLPDRDTSDGLNYLETALTVREINNIIKTMQRTEVNLRMPKFKMSDEKV